MDAQHARHKLQIIAGLHKGAELGLQEGSRYTIGSGEQCDIVLLDDGIAAEHLCLNVSAGQVHLQETRADTFIDGEKLSSSSARPLIPFQVVSLGDTHLAIGPVDATWPAIDPPDRLEDTGFVTTRDLVPVPGNRLPKKRSAGDRFKRLLRTLQGKIAQTNRKLLAAISIFMVALFIFIGDTWLSHAVLDTVEENLILDGRVDRKSMDSPLLTIVDGIRSVHQDTLINTGIAEPCVPTETKLDASGIDPVDHIRQALKSAWGDHLREIPATGHNILFKGFDEYERQNLRLDLEENAQGDIEAKAVTLAPKKKKEILSQVGDFIRLKVELAEEMESACQRVLVKKGIRKARARYDIQENAFTLEGQTNDADAIDTVADIIAKAFPDIQMKNDIQKLDHKPARTRIKAVSTSGLPFVILNDGSKVFTGGKLNNGCTIAAIAADHILIDCNGSKRRQRL
jgi:hypothetical protein